MSKRAVPGSATEGWHQRVLFSEERAGREPDGFYCLPGLGRCYPGRDTLTIILQNSFLRAIGNLGDPGVLLYHNKEIENRRASETVRNSDRCGDPDPLTLTLLGVPGFLSTSDIPSITLWISEPSPASSSPASSSCLDAIWEGGADPGRLTQFTQSVCP